MFPNAGSKPFPNNLSGSVVLSPDCSLESPGGLLEHSCTGLCQATGLRVSGSGVGRGKVLFKAQQVIRICFLPSIRQGGGLKGEGGRGKREEGRAKGEGRGARGEGRGARGGPGCPEEDNGRRAMEGAIRGG